MTELIGGEIPTVCHKCGWLPVVPGMATCLACWHYILKVVDETTLRGIR